MAELNAGFSDTEQFGTGFQDADRIDADFENAQQVDVSFSDSQTFGAGFGEETQFNVDFGSVPVSQEPTLSYLELQNKPSIETVELVGDKKFEDLGIHHITNAELAQLLV